MTNSKLYLISDKTRVYHAELEYLLIYRNIAQQEERISEFPKSSLISSRYHIYNIINQSIISPITKNINPIQVYFEG